MKNDQWQKVSLIVTVLNESKTIIQLLESVAKLSILPDEMIIIDGGSTDDTVLRIQQFAKENSQLKIICKTKKGNRSIGRNFAVSLSKYQLIAITDAGCILHSNWLKELLIVYKERNEACDSITDLAVTNNIKRNTVRKSPQVVAGFYSAKPKSNFQKAVVPYVLVMPDKVDPISFLPATRSMLLEKKVFLEIGGFDEKLDDNEDFAFAKKLKAKKKVIVFSKKAIVYWQPSSNVSEFYRMIFRFSRGDIFSGIIRPKVISMFGRYFVFLFLLFVSSKLLLSVLGLYTLWSILKNKRYVGTAWKYLPLLQFISDFAVLHGSVVGLIKKLKSRA